MTKIYKAFFCSESPQVDQYTSDDLISREENHILIPRPHHLPNPSHLQRLLSLINTFLITARCDEWSRTPGCYQFTESEGLRWQSFYLFTFFSTSLSKLKGTEVYLKGIIATSLLKLQGQDDQAFVTRTLKLKGRDDQVFCCQINEAQGSRWPGLGTSILKLKVRDNQVFCCQLNEVEGPR